MKKSGTIFLRFLLFIFGLGVLVLCIMALPAVWRDGPKEFPPAANFVHLIVIGMYATTIPFYIGLFKTFKLLNYIDKNIAFSELSVKALKVIKICGTIISIFYVLGVPLLFPIADYDDAPGLILMGGAVACAPVAISVFAAVLQKLLQNAINIKKENDLTV